MCSEYKMWTCTSLNFSFHFLCTSVFLLLLWANQPIGVTLSDNTLLQLQVDACQPSDESACTRPTPSTPFFFFLSATQGYFNGPWHMYRSRGTSLTFFFFKLMVTGSQKVHWSLVVSHFQGIEQLKKEERRWAKKTKWMNMRAVFGHHFSILWFSPFSTPDHGKAETYQYVVWGLSAGNKADRSKVKVGRWVQPQKAMLNTINTPVLAMDSPPSASCVVN